MVAVVLVLLLALALGCGLLVLARTLQRQLEQRSADVDRRLQAVVETMDRRLGDQTQTTARLHEHLGRLNEGVAQMVDRAKELGRLEQALRPPKARGGFGELLLENLLRDRLPPSAFAMQHTFASGERVDAVVRVERTIPVDSKFPLDNYNRLVEAEDDESRALHEKQFARDVRQHIDAIAAKYIRPDEGTYDFAFMYIPVEAVYYELACGKTGALLAYAHERRVFPVSPTTFVAYLQVIALGLRGMQVEQHAHEVMAYVAELSRDFERFSDDFDKVGTHLQHAQSRYHEARKGLDRFESKLERAAEEQPELEQQELVLELPAA